MKDDKKGCYLCIHLMWFESDYEYELSGYYCDKRDEWEDFKTFPCLRKLPCRVLQETK